MNKFYYILPVTLIITTLSYAQTFVADRVLSNDTTSRSILLKSFEGLLASAEKPVEQNEFVLTSEQVETALLLDELKDQRKSIKFNDDNFYKPVITNVVSLKEHFLIQVSFLGYDGAKPLARSSFTFAAQRQDQKFLFYSPLKYNTVSWKTQTLPGFNIHYAINWKPDQTAAFINTIGKYDNKLGARPMPTDIYCATDLPEVMRLIGVDFKSDYSGTAHGSCGSSASGRSILVDAFYLAPDVEKFDPHDLWHDRLHNVVSTAVINRPVDEGTAYLYGGSWGYTWEEIRLKFLTYAKSLPHADWLSLYNESVNFDPDGKYPLRVDFVINALIVQKVEKEKGFPSVIELLSCGKKIAGNDNYFAALERVAGIKKDWFNKFVDKLIRESR